jgi:murein DD-endopeptidase MepM/ murein hydrolase activator NlpD
MFTGRKKVNWGGVFPGEGYPAKRLLVVLLFLFTLAACTQAPRLTPPATPAGESTHQATQLSASQALEATPTLQPPPAQPATVVSQPAPQPDAGEKTPVVQKATSTAFLPIPTLAVTATPCGAGQCFATNTLLLARPIASPDNDQPDQSYRFGSTQDNTRAPHHGVEFINPEGTPVLAAAEGVVEIAGNDRTTLYGPYKYFYGNLVILRHELPPSSLAGLPLFPTPVYTLYAHLSEITVTPGQLIKTGQVLGKVGMTGSATGNHLHFEVRLGENTYQSAHNPELWLAPSMGENGQYQGAIAGQVIDQRGQTIAVQDVAVQSLPTGPEGAPGLSVYINSYEEPGLLGRQPWQESFALGGLDPGWYRVSFVRLGMQTQDVQVLPGQVTVVVFKFAP